MLNEKSVMRSEELFSIRLRSVFQKFGYQRYKMSRFEEYDIYAKNKDFLISENVITFPDSKGRLMALKPDVTLSIVRSFNDRTPEVQKLYYDEKVYRTVHNSADFKEITQLGLECIGDIDEISISEVLVLALKSLQEISDEYILNISDIDIISKELSRLDVPEDTKKEILKAVGDKNFHELSMVLSSMEAEPEQKRRIEVIAKTSGEPEAVISSLRNEGITGVELDILERIVKEIRSAGFSKGVKIDFSVLSNTSYYNGVVFNGYVSGVSGKVISGGRYDKLLQKMGKKKKAIGFAIYLDELERLSDEKPMYDVDTVLLYNENDTDVTLKAKKLMDEGQSVLLSRTVPENRRYRKIVKAEDVLLEV